MKHFYSLLIASFLLFVITSEVRAQNVSFTTDKILGCKPLIVTFTNTSSVGVTYKWHLYRNQLGTPYDSALTKNVNYTFTEAGSYDIYLDAFDINGIDMGATTANVNVEGGNNYFYPVTDTVCLNDEITFVATANFENWNTLYTCYWSFGDGDTAQQVTSYLKNGKEYHSYSAPGNYKVTLVLVTPCSTDTIVQYVVVDNSPPAPLTKFTASARVVCPNTDLHFVANNTIFFTPKTYSWDFGDGTPPATKANPLHTYTTTGNKLVTLTVSNNCGNTNSYSDTIFVVDTIVPPLPRFQPYPSAVCVGDKVFMWDESGQLNDKFSYQWHFGDGKTDTGFEPKHIYTGTGTFLISRVVTNGCGNTNSFSDTVNVSHNAQPPVQFDVVINGISLWNGNVGCPNDKFLFLPYSYLDWFITLPPFDATSYQWNFGDGGHDTLRSPIHYYTKYGTYTVSLLVTNSCGNASTSTTSVIIGNSNPVFPGFSWMDANGNSPGTVNTCEPLLFTGYGGATYQWNFGDGTILSPPTDTVTHAYSLPGTYNILITATNGCSMSATATSAITVQGACTGINEAPAPEATSIIIYPNPFSSTATLEINDARFINAHISFYNMVGQEVMSREIKNSKSEISRGNLPAGIYFYRISGMPGVPVAGKVVIE